MDRPIPSEDEPAFPGWLKPVSIEMSFETVSPEALSLLTGGVMGTPPEPMFSLEVWSDIPWRWRQWQWWLQHTPWRRPKRKQYTLIPHARIKTERID